jgi:hypothetical protein
MVVTDPHKCYTKFPLGNKLMAMMMMMMKRSARGRGDFSDAQKMLTTGHQGRTHTETLHVVTDNFISYVI